MNGLTYLWGNISPYVLSYFHFYGGEDGQGQQDIDFYDSVYVVPMMAIVLMFMNPLGAYLFRYGVSPRLLVSVGSITMVVAVYCLTLTVTFRQFIAVWALQIVGAGLCYFPPLLTGWEWFEGREGVVTGVVLGAFGFSSFIFSFVALALINPDNEQPTMLPDGHLIYSPEIASRVSRPP